MTLYQNSIKSALIIFLVDFYYNALLLYSNVKSHMCDGLPLRVNLSSSVDDGVSVLPCGYASDIRSKTDEGNPSFVK